MRRYRAPVSIISGSLPNSGEPCVRKECPRRPTDLGDHAADRRAEPRDFQCAFAPACANGGADHRDKRRAETESDRDQQIFKPRADAVAGDGGRSVDCDKRGRNSDREIGRDRDDARDQSDAQDVARQRPVQGGRRFRRHKYAAARPDVEGQYRTTDDVIRRGQRSRRLQCQAPESGPIRKSGQEKPG